MQIFKDSNLIFCKLQFFDRQASLDLSENLRLGMVAKRKNILKDKDQNDDFDFRTTKNDVTKEYKK